MPQANRFRITSTRRLSFLAGCLAWALCLLAALASCRRADVAEPESGGVARQPIGRVTLEIDFGAEPAAPPKRLQVACYPADTVADVLQRAHGDGQIELQMRGSGPLAFIEAIDGIHGGATRGWWTYQVNGQLADKGAGVFNVQPDDTITWTLGHRNK